jgi:hypothetical protein
MRATISCSASGASPFRDVRPDIVAECSDAGKGETRYHRKHRCKRDSAYEPKERISTDRQRQEGRGHVASTTRLEHRFRTHEDHRSKSDNEDEKVEYADQAGRIEDGESGFAHVPHRVDAHQNVWHCRRSEHKAETQRYRIPLAALYHPAPVAALLFSNLSAAAAEQRGRIHVKVRGTRAQYPPPAMSEGCGLNDLDPRRASIPPNRT